MSDKFKRRMYIEKFVLHTMTKELEEILSLGLLRNHFTEEFHRDMYDNLLFRSKCNEDISKPSIFTLAKENPSPKEKMIIEVYRMSPSDKITVTKAVEEIKVWAELMAMRSRALHLIHLIENWDFKESIEMINDLADNIRRPEVIQADIESNFTPDYCKQWRDRVFSPKKQSRTIETGICYLDRKLGGGFKTTKLYTVAARTGCGKTAFATNITLAAAKQGYHCLYVTLEMNKYEIHCRFSAAMAEVNIGKFDTASFDSEEAERVKASAEKMNDICVHVLDSSRGDWSKVEKKIREIKRTSGLSFVVVDYIQQYSCPTMGFKASDKRQEINYMTGRFKQLALELDFAAIMVAQLNRDMEKDGDREPRLSDIKDSSSIEQDSDSVLMLYCTNQPKVDNGTDREKDISIKITKNRNGEMGRQQLKTKLSINKFYPL